MSRRLLWPKSGGQEERQVNDKLTVFPLARCCMGVDHIPSRLTTWESLMGLHPHPCCPGTQKLCYKYTHFLDMLGSQKLCAFGAFQDSPSI